jgi:hypothetical protein
MTKLRTSLGDGSSGGPFRRSEPARKGERSGRRVKARAIRHRKVRRVVRAGWPDRASSCDGKVRHTEAAARGKAGALSKPGEPMNAYLCGYCGWFHVGHAAAGKMGAA